jgi:hypothetical protein
VHQQRLFPRRAAARNLIQRARADGLGAFRAIRADGEAVDFVAQAPEVEQDRRVDRKGKLAPVKR